MVKKLLKSLLVATACTLIIGYMYTHTQYICHGTVHILTMNNGPKIVGAAAIGSKKIALQHPVDQLVLKTIGECVVIEGETPAIIVTANENILNQIDVCISGGCVALELKDGVYQNITVTYMLIVPRLPKVFTVTGSTRLIL